MKYDTSYMNDGIKTCNFLNFLSQKRNNLLDKLYFKGSKTTDRFCNLVVYDVNTSFKVRNPLI